MLTTPLLILLFVSAIDLGMAFSEHGKPKKGNNNAWATIFALVVVFFLIYLHSAILLEGK